MKGTELCLLIKIIRNITYTKQGRLSIFYLYKKSIMFLQTTNFLKRKFTFFCYVPLLLYYYFIKVKQELKMIWRLSKYIIVYSCEISINMIYYQIKTI